MPYSEITEGDRKEIEMNPFVEDTVLELDSVTVRILKQDNVNRFTIMTNEIGGFSLKDFVTYWRKKFNRDKSKQVVINENDDNRTNVLTAAEMKQLIVGKNFTGGFLVQGTSLMEIVSQIVTILTIIQIMETMTVNQKILTLT